MMPLNRPVMMDDGTVRRVHTITCIRHFYEDQATFITVVSSADGMPDVVTETRCTLNDLLSLDKAYALLEEHPSFKEYEDDAQIAIDILRPMLTDEQAELVTRFFPEWEPDVLYSVGDRVKYGSKLYRCLQAHTSQPSWMPPVSPSLWVRTAADPDVIEDWVQPLGSEDAYMKGDVVRHDSEAWGHPGTIWVSIIDANVWEPGVYGWDIKE